MKEMNQVQYDEINLFELFQTLWDGKWLISAFVAIAVLLGGGFLLSKDAVYESKLNYSVDTIPPFYEIEKVSTDFKKKFDVVLCDVPCTGTGTWRRRPENIIRLKEDQLNELVKVQASILNDASSYCKNGGELVYISCSLLYEENEGQIKKFLKIF